MIHQHYYAVYIIKKVVYLLRIGWSTETKTDPFFIGNSPQNIHPRLLGSRRYLARLFGSIYQ